MDDLYDVNIFFIPVLTGTNFSFAASIKKKFKENTQEDLQPHVLFCTEKGKDILNDLQMQKSDVPYFFSCLTRMLRLFTGRVEDIRRISLIRWRSS